MTLLRVEGIVSRYGLLHAVREVSFQMAQGETLALVGANGAGKTTLLRTVAGAHRPAAGRVLFEGADVTTVPSHRRVRMGIALVPEGRRLFPGLTVEENLAVAAVKDRTGRWTVQSVLEAFPLLQPLRKRAAANLSGGEQQATAIGRALMSNPRLLLLDEVSLGLAPAMVDTVYRSLQTVMQEGTAVLVVEQDLGRALDVAGRVMCMLEGRIVLQDEAKRLSREQVTEAYFGLRTRRERPFLPHLLGEVAPKAPEGVLPHLLGEVPRRGGGGDLGQRGRPGGLPRRLLRAAGLRPLDHVRGDADHQPRPRRPGPPRRLRCVAAARAL